MTSSEPALHGWVGALRLLLIGGLLAGSGCRYDPTRVPDAARLVLRDGSPPPPAPTDGTTAAPRDGAREPELSPGTPPRDAAGPDAPPPGPAPLDGAAPDTVSLPPAPCSVGQTGACYTGPNGTRGVGACREGVQTCLPGGTWGPCTGEGRPAAEICDGEDDDCDGVVDDGCPVDSAPVFTEGPRVSSPVFGSLTLEGNSSVSHRCPAGQAAIAVTGNFGYALDSLGLTCGTLRVREDRSATPFRYALEVEPGQVFPPVGGASGGLNDQTRCPPGSVIAALAAWPTRPQGPCPAAYCADVRAPDCPSNFGLEVTCVRFEITGAPGAFRIAAAQQPPFRAAARVEVDLAGLGFPAVRADYACPAGQVVVDAAGSVGPWPYDCAKTTVNGLRAACTQPVVRLR